MSNLTKCAFPVGIVLATALLDVAIEKAWDQSSRFDKFCFFFTVKEKWIIRVELEYNS